jgi:prepilin-type N-terminal cleavage/methylation domain-containing protein
MKTLRSNKLNISDQHGFTILELLVALTISAVIGTVVMVSLFQIMNVSEGNKNRITAINQVENALQYVNRDVQSANSITLDSTSDSGFPVSMIWKTWDNKTCKAVYLMESGKMIRNYYENDLANPLRVNMVAQSIDTSSTSRTNCEYNNNLFTIKLTSTVGTYKPVSVSRTINVSPRSIHFYN